MKLNVYQTIYIGQVEVDDTSVVSAATRVSQGCPFDGDEQKVQNFINQEKNAQDLNMAEVQEQYFCIADEE